MKPLNNEHLGTANYFWPNFTVDIEDVLFSSEVKFYCHGPIETSEFVLYKEVKCYVSFIWHVL